MSQKLYEMSYVFTVKLGNYDSLGGVKIDVQIKIVFVQVSMQEKKFILWVTGCDEKSVVNEWAHLGC